MPQDSSPLASAQVTVASWDVDACNRLTTAALGRHMQETAELSAARMGASFHELRRANQTWVLSSLLLRIDRFPGFQDRITVETWPRDIVRRRALRDFRILDAQDTVIATATTSWYCIDLDRRRPMDPGQWRTSPWLTDQKATDRDPDKLPGVITPSAEAPVPLRWCDLDLNGHLTNTRYQELVLECYPESWLRSREVAEIELNFLAEGHYPETLLSRRQADETMVDAWHHDLVRQSDGKAICRARVVWR